MVGAGASVSALILFGIGWDYHPKMQCPRYSTEDCMKVHLLWWNLRPAVSRWVRTSSSLCKCSSSDLPVIRMLLGWMDTYSIPCRMPSMWYAEGLREQYLSLIDLLVVFAYACSSYMRQLTRAMAAVHQEWWLLEAPTLFMMKYWNALPVWIILGVVWRILENWKFVSN